MQCCGMLCSVVEAHAVVWRLMHTEHCASLYHAAQQSQHCIKLHNTRHNSQKTIHDVSQRFTGLHNYLWSSIMLHRTAKQSTTHQDTS